MKLLNLFDCGGNIFMSKNCLEGYLTPECKTCPDWRNTATECGCAIHAPIMSCRHFAKVYSNENESSKSSKNNLPSAIFMNTSGGETLLIEACSEYCYSKGYYPTGNFPKEELSTKIRRLKIVNAPFYVEGKAFGTTNSLFDYLLKTGRYFKYPY